MPTCAGSSLWRVDFVRFRVFSRRGKFSRGGFRGERSCNRGGWDGIGRIRNRSDWKGRGGEDTRARRDLEGGDGHRDRSVLLRSVQQIELFAEEVALLAELDSLGDAEGEEEQRAAGGNTGGGGGCVFVGEFFQALDSASGF